MSSHGGGGGAWGGGGAKQSAAQPAAARPATTTDGAPRKHAHAAVRVLSRGFPLHVPLARTLLAECLWGRPSQPATGSAAGWQGADAGDAPAEEPCGAVEAVGSGAVLVRRLVVCRNWTVQRLKDEIGRRLRCPERTLRVFLGHGGPELHDCMTCDALPPSSPPPPLQQPPGLEQQQDDHPQALEDGFTLTVLWYSSWPDPAVDCELETPASEAAGGLHTLYAHKAFALCVAWDPSGTRLASSSNNNDISVMVAAAPALPVTVNGGTAAAAAAALPASSVSVSLLPSSASTSVAPTQVGAMSPVAAAATGRRWWTAHTKAVVSVAWSPDGRRLASGSRDHTVRVWDAMGTPAATQCLQTFTGHSNHVATVQWHSQGDRIASASGDTTVKVWAVRTDRHGAGAGVGDDGGGEGGGDTGGDVVDDSLITLEGHHDHVRDIDWHPDGGARLVSASSDKTARVWDTESGKCLVTFLGHKAFVWVARWAPDGARIASAGHRGPVFIWDAATSAVLAQLSGFTELSTVRTLAWHPDGNRLASAGDNRIIRVWDTARATQVAASPCAENSTAFVFKVCWHPDGCRLATVSGDKRVRVWRVRMGEGQESESR